LGRAFPIGTGLEHRMPEDFLFGHPETTEGIDTHQYGELFDGYRYPVDKIIKVPELAMELPFGQQALDDRPFEVPQVSQPQVDVTAMDDIDVVAEVDTGRKDSCAPHFGLMGIEFHIIEATAIVEHGHHELQREITF